MWSTKDKPNGMFNSYIENPLAFCRLHRVDMSIKHIKKKRCLEKHCRYFSKYVNHSYWTQLKLKEELKQENKLNKKRKKHLNIST